MQVNNITTNLGEWEVVYKLTGDYAKDLDKYKEMLLIYGNVSLGPVGGEEIYFYILKL